MSRKYDKRLKASVVYDICELGKSTSRTAKEYNIPLKTVEKQVTAYHKVPRMDNPEGQVTYPIINRTAGLPTGSGTSKMHVAFLSLRL